MCIQWFVLACLVGSVSSKINITGSSTYYVNGEPFNLTCTSDQKPDIRDKGRVNFYDDRNGSILFYYYNDGWCDVYYTTYKSDSVSCLAHSKPSTFIWTMRREIKESMVVGCEIDYYQLGIVENASLFINFAYGPTFVSFSPKQSIFVINETEALGPIECVADCFPKCTFQWTGQDVVTNGSNLYIEKVTRSKKGTYICLAQNIVGNNTANVSVEVQYEPSSLLLDPNHSIITVNEGNRVGPVTCKADCVPYCTYHWIGDGICENGSKLLITNVNRSSDGYYMCNATNMLGSRTVYLRVVVQYGPNSILFNPSKTEYTIQEGSPFGPITCTSICNPGCKREWTGSGIGTAVNPLYLSSITRNHTGQFTCNATNIVGFYQKSINIVVLYKPTTLSITPNVKAITLAEGQKLGPYSCLADCLPSCNFTWDYPMNYRNNVSVLEIKTVNITNNGTYTCTATNILGESVLTLDVNVECNPRLDINTTNSPSVIPLKSGMTLNITLNLISNPVPDVEIHFSKRNSVENFVFYPTRTIDGFQVLATFIVQKIEFSHFGHYTFVASNGLGTFRHEYTVAQEEEPTAPVIIFVTCKSTSVNIYWKPEFNGGLEQHFYIQYWNINKPSSVMFTHNISDLELHAEIQHKIENLLSTTTYEFVIVAENRVGISRSIPRNCTTDSSANLSERQDVLVGGISTLVIGLLISIFGIFLLFVYYFRLCHGKQSSKMKRKHNYTEFQTYTPPTNEEYENLNVEQGTLEKKQKIKSHGIDNQSNVDPTKSSANTTHAYQNIQLNDQKKEKREAVYANL